MQRPAASKLKLNTLCLKSSRNVPDSCHFSAVLCVASRWRVERLLLRPRPPLPEAPGRWGHAPPSPGQTPPINYGARQRPQTAFPAIFKRGQPVTHSQPSRSVKCQICPWRAARYFGARGILVAPCPVCGSRVTYEKPWPSDAPVTLDPKLRVQAA